MKNFWEYTAFGMHIQSQLKLPVCAKTHNKKPDCTVHIGAVKGSIHTPIQILNANHIIISVPGVAHYAIKNKRQIIVQPLADADEQMVSLYLQGSILAALLYQQHVFPLHACGIDIDGQCYVFLGNAGVGKSSLAAGCAARGLKVLFDDICVMRRCEQNVFLAYPAHPYIKLWQNVAELFDIKVSTLKQIHAQHNKYYFPLKNNWCRRPLPVSRMFFLNTHSSDKFQVETLNGGEKIIKLRCHNYRPYFIDAFNLHQPFFKFARDVSQNIPMATITRPNKFNGITSIDKMITFIMKTGLEKTVSSRV